MSEDLCFLYVDKLVSLIQRREVSPVELTRVVLARAKQLQPELNCFITLCGELAMVQARHAEQTVMAGGRLGLLHGIPFTVKDIVNTKG